jgi:hypothetical protein
MRGRPGNLVVNAGDVWMADFFEGVLWRYSPATEGLQRITSAGEPRDIAALGGDVYVAADGEYLSGIVSRYDAGTGIREDGIDLLACAIAAGDGVVWTAGCPFVQRLNTDGRPLRKLREIFLPYLSPSTSENSRVQFRELAVGAGSLWVLGDALDRRLWRLDARTGRVLATVPLDFPPRSVAVGGGVVWITDSLGDEIRRLDIATNRLLEPLPAGRSPGGVAVGEEIHLGAERARRHGHSARYEYGETVATIDVGGFPRSNGERRHGVGDRLKADPRALLTSLLLVGLAFGCGGDDRATFRIGVLTDCVGIYRTLEDAELSGAQLPLIERGARLRGSRPGEGLTSAKVAGVRVELVRGCTETGEFTTMFEQVRRLVDREKVERSSAARSCRRRRTAAGHGALSGRLHRAAERRSRSYAAGTRYLPGGG